MPANRAADMESAYRAMFAHTLGHGASDVQVQDLAVNPDFLTRFARSCAHHRVEAHLAEWLLARGQSVQGLDPKRTVTEAKARALQLDHACAELSVKFNSAGIRHRVLRGPVAARRLMSQPHLRTSRDLDFIVEEAGLEAAGELLKQLGYEPGAGLQECRRSGEWAFRSARGLVVELHWDAYPCLGGRGLGPKGEDIWAEGLETEIEGVKVPGISDRHLLLSSVLHAAYEHQMDRLVRMVDVGQCVRLFGSAFDWDWFTRACIDGRHATAAYKVLRLATRVTGTEPPQRVMAALKDASSLRWVSDLIIPDEAVLESDRPVRWLRRYAFLQVLKRAG